MTQAATKTSWATKRPRLIAIGAIVTLLGALASWARIDLGAYQQRVAVETAPDVQEHIAGFTYGMLLLSAFSALVSCATLIFLFLAFRESRRMTEETRRAADVSLRAAEQTQALTQKQYRAYLRAESARIVAEGDKYTVKVSYRNDGATPALDIEHAVVVALRGEKYSHSPDQVFDADRISYVNVRPVPPLTDDMFRYEVSSAAFEMAEAGAQRQPGQVVTFIGAVIYRDTFGSRFQTQFEFFLQPERADDLRNAIEAQKQRNEIVNVGVDLKWGRRGRGGVYHAYEGDPPPFLRT